MIFYFSGTGNSFYVARKTAEKLGGRLVSIASEMNGESKEFRYDLEDDEVLGFVFPVYAWAPPRMVLDFIERLKLSGKQRHYVFAAAVCGDEAGDSIKVLERSLLSAGLGLDSAFSVTMPNNYIVLFDVDSEENERRKLEAAERTIGKIAETAANRTPGVFEVHRGSMVGLKTAVFGSLFSKYGISTKYFYADEKCNGCGICEKVCSCGSIAIAGGRPKWGSSCTQCLACLHYCPMKAVQFGRMTKNKGRYTNPNVSLKEMLKR